MRHILLLTCVVTFILPLGAQEPAKRRRDIEQLTARQKEAVARLERILKTIDGLATELEERGDTQKAKQLREAVARIQTRAIPISTLAKGDGTGSKSLGDLVSAMNTMASILEQSPERAPEVGEIGIKVIDLLSEIVTLLSGEDDLASLEQREKNLEDARDEVRKAARRQAELRKQTRASTPRSPAESAAEQGRRALDKLLKEIDALDRDARNQLAKLDEARERASRLEALARRQRALRTETKIRGGAADTLRPKINRAVAELESLQRAAQDAADKAADRDAARELSQKVAELAERQKQLAADIAARHALERAVSALAPQAKIDGAELENVLKEASAATPDSAKAEADALRQAAGAKLTPDEKKRAQEAAESALDQSPSRETLQRDEQVMAREIERAAKEADGDVAKKLDEAKHAAFDAAKALERGRSASEAAENAYKALTEAAKALAQKGAKASEESRNAEADKQAKRAADARKLAKELEKMANENAAEEAGLKESLSQGAHATSRAAKDLDKASASTRKGKSVSTKRHAQNAAERLEQTARELKQAMEERENLTKRQKDIAEDLKRAAENAPAETKENANGAARKAVEAAEHVKRGEFQKATDKQADVLQTIEQMAKGARAAAEQAASGSQSKLGPLQKRTEQSAKRADETAKKLEEGARRAREDESRGKMETAAERTREAAEALRKSLKRLSEAMPKSAEQDRAQARKQIEEARRAIKDVRERKKQQEKTPRKDLAEKQQRLEQDVKRLEDRLRKMKENSGVERLQDAQSAMRQAGQKLEQGEMDEAERAQERAQKSLEQTEKELKEEERRYRQLRQHELLFRLRNELKEFRRASQAHLETIQKIDAEARKAGRVTRALYRTEVQPLTRQIDELERGIGKKADAIEREGAVVYTYLLRGCGDDLKELTVSLRAREVGLLPQELLGDVIRRFDMALKGLERDIAEKKQQAQQQQQGQQGGGQGQGGGQPRLVPPNAEVRMVLVLQRALNEERENFFKSRPGFGQTDPKDGEKARLERMYHQQGSLAELFDSLRESLLGGENQDDPFRDEEEQR
ncbi:MAG: hypothetical protein V3T86_17495 [Planctomycetota bacterium]